VFTGILTAAAQFLFCSICTTFSITALFPLRGRPVMPIFG